MKIKTIKTDAATDGSKLFGDSYIPDKWLEDNVFSPFEFFLCQIDLKKIKVPGLPEKGYLYFFVDAVNFNFGKMTARLRYCEDEPDAYTDFNEGYFDEDPEVYALVPEEEEEKEALAACGSLLFCEKGEDGKIILLKVDDKFLPDVFEGMNFTFEMDESDFKGGNFEKTVLKTV